MGSSATDTEQLLTRWHAGDQEALDGLLTRAMPWVRQTVRSRIGPLIRAKEESGDIVQEVVIEFLRYGPRFLLKNGRHLRSLLARIAENVLRGRSDHFLAQRRSLNKERPLPSDSVIDLTVHAKTREQPSRIAEQNETEATVHLALALICPDDREVLLMRHWDRLPFDKIGDSIGVSEDAARMRFHRALARLAHWVQRTEQGRIHELLDSDDDP